MSDPAPVSYGLFQSGPDLTPYKPQSVDPTKRLRWRLQEFLHHQGAANPIGAADQLLTLLANELMASPPGTVANQYGNELRRWARSRE
jgi:hypothetical protein